MNDLEKLRVILPHWIDHNSDHGQEYTQWAGLMDSCGQDEIAELLRKAEKALQQADTALKEALRKAGGPVSGEGHHHHHHNLPE